MKVELHPAYFFTCEECGRDSFCRMVKGELSPEEMTELARRNGWIEPFEELGPDEGVEALLSPDRVTCDHCGAEFDAEFPSSPPNEGMNR